MSAADILSQVFGIWYLIGAALVFFMQAGFAMVEAGFTRLKNTGNIIMKNLMDFCLGTVAFLILGYSLLCGKDVGGFFGWGENPLFNFANTDWSLFTFNLVFCATAATIVSGAMAERTKFIAYCIYSFVISLFIYPIEAHWVWGGGFLANMGFHDFAGSGVIHFVGGLVAFIGAAMLGPRIGKYDEDGVPHGIPGHNIAIGALGVFILWFGWYGFNGAAATNSLQLSTIFATTTVAPAVASCTVMTITWLKYGKPDVSMTLNGSLAGLVAITAGCDAVNIFGSFMIGIISGCTVCFLVWLLDYKLKVDDPVGAVAVHCGNGIMGIICTGLFACGTDTMPEAQGLFYGGGFHFLGVQLFGLVVIGAWTAVMAFLTFFVLKHTVGLRVSEEEEIVGLDKMEHGLDSAYAGFATLPDPFGRLVDVTGASEEELAEMAEAAKPSADAASGIPAYSEDVESSESGEAPALRESPSGMSEVIIITKQERFETLKKAMDEIGITGMTVTRVSGCGVEKGHDEYYRGAKVESTLIPKLKVEIVVSSVPVNEVIMAARRALYTGHMGDGKIFVYNVAKVVRISTGSQNADALKYEELA
ncbi:MAG: ammonium transporter [Eubacteriales bacterium]|nr:ammonium transporter [Eubacteriales bacterium]